MMDQFTVVADQRIYNNNCRFLKGSLSDAFFRDDLMDFR